MKKLLLILLCAPMIGVGQGSNNNSIRSAAYYNKGLKKVELQDYSGAIADFTEAIRLAPDAAAYNNRGVVKNILKDYSGAIADFTEAIELNEKIKITKDDWPIITFKDGGSIGDIDCDYYYNRGMARYKLQDYSGAIADYTEAIRIEPGYAKAYNNRGIAKVKLKNYSGAIADYTEAIRIEPGYAKAYGNRGSAKESTRLLYCSDYKMACDLGLEIACEWYREQCK